MYIHKIGIKHIRSIREFNMEFPLGEEAGWHVILAANGMGKSTLIRSIAAALIGPEELPALRTVWADWLQKGQNEGSIELELLPDWTVDSIGRGQPPKNKTVKNKLILESKTTNVHLASNIRAKKMSPSNYNWSSNQGWFSVAYGPFRRFTGGDSNWNKVYYSAPKAGAHLSVFGEDVALTEALDWLKDLDLKRLKALEAGETESDEAFLYEKIKQFINQSKLLPENVQFEKIDKNGEPIFKDPQNQGIRITELSDGYRSILSLIFELLRQLIRVYGLKAVFPEGMAENDQINLPGVVLIDEIDAHLHPSWQAEIGNWFLRLFPKIQFIVSTHSPIICRAAEKGSIWRLGHIYEQNNLAGKVVGEDFEQLVYGNILEAIETNTFGQSLARSKSAQKLQAEYQALSRQKRYYNNLSKEEEERFLKLQSIFHSDV